MSMAICISASASSIHVAQVQANPGDEGVELAISLKNDKSLSGAELLIEYDYSVMTLDTIESGARLSGFSDVGYYEYSYGKVAGVFFDITGLALPADSGEALKLNFNIKADAWVKLAEVNITEITAVDEDLELEPIAVTNGGIDLIGVYICGDVDDDDIVNILDIIYLINYKFKGGTAPIVLESADVNSDGTINILDIIYLVNYKFKGGPEPDCLHDKGVFAGKSNPAKRLKGDFRVEQVDGKYQLITEYDDILKGLELTLSIKDGEVELTNFCKGMEMYYHQSGNEVVVGILDPKGDGELSKGINRIFSSASPFEITYMLGASKSNEPVYFTSEPSNLPTEFALDQNYPNPFNPNTTIKFALPVASEVELNIYNILGQKVKSLVGGHLEAGYYSLVWDGTNSGGVAVASGVYFYRIKAGEFTQSKKMILIK